MSYIAPLFVVLSLTDEFSYLRLIRRWSLPRGAPLLIAGQTFVTGEAPKRNLASREMSKAIKRLKPDVQRFFDTNLFLLCPTDVPTLKNVPINRRWVTETVFNEVHEKLDDAAAKHALKSYQVLRFDNVYSNDPNVCPTFYAYVEAIFSPAIVGSEDFLEELLLSRRIRGVEKDDEHRLYERLRTRSANSRATMPDGTPKSEGLRKLERYDAATRRKIVATIRDGHPAVIRDIKNLALTLYYCLNTQQNVIFYTADADPVSPFFRWLDAMSMRVSLIHQVLNRLRTNGVAHVARSGRTRLVIPIDEFLDGRHRLWNDMVRDSYKTAGCRFTIKRWDQKTHAFDEDVYITFEKAFANCPAQSHGNMQCHFTRNNDLGNWLHLVYEWPPVDPTCKDLCVTVRTKGCNDKSIKVSPEEHDRECLYRRTDAAGHLYEWSQFKWDREPLFPVTTDHCSKENAG